jgi:hypothetical protein
MFSTKTRTTVLALVAATALSAGAPVAAAQDDTTPASADQCAMYKVWYEEELKAAGSAVNKHQPGAVTKAYTEAEYTLRLAAGRGCGWATPTVVTKTPAAPKGVIAQGPEAPGKATTAAKPSQGSIATGSAAA